MTQANHSTPAAPPSASNAAADADEEIEFQDEVDPTPGKTHREVMDIKPEWIRAHRAETTAKDAAVAAKAALDAANADAARFAAEREALENEIGEGQVSRHRAKTLIAINGSLYRLRKTRLGPYVLDAAGDAD